MITNDTFKFVVHRKDFLSLSQCQKLMRYLETGEPTESELAGNYDENILNKEVRDNKEVTINNEKLNNKLKMVFELSNQSIWKYNIQEMEKVKILRYENGGKYKWHTDCGAKETSTRKLTLIIQLSDETKYEGGDLEFGITDKSGKNNYTAPRTRGSITIFPAFLSHRVTSVTKGRRYSLITWMLGDLLCMKIALCLCPQWSLTTPSFALGSLSQVLESQGHSVEQIDLNLLTAIYVGDERHKYWRLSNKESPIYDGKVFQANFVDITKRFDKFWNVWIDKMSKFDIVCFTTYSSNITTTDYIARKLKQKNPNIQIWYGGPYCWYAKSGGLVSTKDDVEMYREFVDVGCGLNEGEVIIKDLINQYSSNKNYNGVTGIWTWDKMKPSFASVLPKGRSGRNPVYGGRPMQLVNMNNLEVPTWDKETLKLYEQINSEEYFMLPIQTARGCTFKCTFCSETRLYRYKSAKKVRDDIVKLYNEYGYTDFWFVDSLINGSMKQFEELIDLLNELPFKINWGGYGRTSTKMNDDLMKRAKSSGMNWLEVGVENGIPKILGLMEKGQTPDIIKDVLKHSHNNGVKLAANWIPAYARENSMDFLQNLIFLYDTRNYFDNKSESEGEHKRFVSRVKMMVPVEVHEGTPMSVHKSHYSISDDRFVGDWVSNDYKNNVLNRNIRGHLTHLMLDILDVQNTTMQDIDNNIKLNKMVFDDNEKDITNIDYNTSYLKFANKQKEMDSVEDKEKSIKQSIIDDIKVWIWALYKIKGNFIIDFEFTENFIPQLLENTQFKYKVHCKSYDNNYRLEIHQSLESDDLNYKDTFSQSGNFNEKGYKLKSKDLNYIDSQRYDKYKVSFPRTEMTNQY